jgi:predicted alpha/beta hydrolase
LEHAQKRLAGSDFEKGCPLAAVALESAAQDHKLRKALDEGFKIQAYKNAPIVERIDIDPRNGWGSIGHMGYFRTQAQPLWDRSVQWFRQLIISG